MLFLVCQKPHANRASAYFMHFGTRPNSRPQLGCDIWAKATRGRALSIESCVRAAMTIRRNLRHVCNGLMTLAHDLLPLVTGTTTTQLPRVDQEMLLAPMQQFRTKQGADRSYQKDGGGIGEANKNDRVVVAMNGVCDPANRTR